MSGRRSTSPARRAAHHPVAPRPREPRQPSAFSGGRTWWHFAVDAGALAVLPGIGVLGFGPTFGRDPRYLIAGLGAVEIGWALPQVARTAG